MIETDEDGTRWYVLTVKVPMYEFEHPANQFQVATELYDDIADRMDVRTDRGRKLRVIA
jgi:hypothetical protein